MSPPTNLQLPPCRTLHASVPSSNPGQTPHPTRGPGDTKFSFFTDASPLSADQLAVLCAFGESLAPRLLILRRYHSKSPPTIHRPRNGLPRLPILIEFFFFFPLPSPGGVDALHPLRMSGFYEFSVPLSREQFSSRPFFFIFAAPLDMPFFFLLQSFFLRPPVILFQSTSIANRVSCGVNFSLPFFHLFSVSLWCIPL